MLKQHTLDEANKPYKKNWKDNEENQMGTDDSAETTESWRWHYTSQTAILGL